MDKIFEEKKRVFSKCRELSKTILEGLKNEDQRKQLNTICMIEDIPDLSCDEEMKNMQDYKEIRGILKKVYIEVARTIMKILDSTASFSGDVKSSFNYTEPLDQMLAVEYIKILPNAYIAGPMKSAVNHPHPKVARIAVEYYDSLPSDLKYSGLLPIDFKNVIRKRKLELKM